MLSEARGPRSLALAGAEHTLSGPGANQSPGQLVVLGNTVFIGSASSSYVFAVDAPTGATLWSRPGGYPVVTPDGKIIAGFSQAGPLGELMAGTLFAYDANGGTAWTWTTPINAVGVQACAVAPDGSIYGSYYSQPQQGSIYTGVMRFKLNAAGQMQWHVGGTDEYLGGTIPPPMLLSNGDLIWVGRAPGWASSGLRRINAVTGAMMWGIEGVGASSLILPGDRILSVEMVGETAMVVMARDASDGHEVWRTHEIVTPQGGGSGPLALLPDESFLLLFDKGYRFSTANGTPLSTFPFPASIPAGTAGGFPVISADGMLYFWQSGSFRYSGRLFGMNPYSGEAILEYPANNFACRAATQPVLTPDGSLFVAWNTRTVCNDPSGVVTHVRIAPPSSPISLTLAMPAPYAVTPGRATPLDLLAVAGTQAVDPTSVSLWYRLSSGAPYQPVAASHVAGSLFRASLPPTTCGQTEQYYFTARGVGGTSVSLPATAPASVYSAVPATLQDQAILQESFNAPGIPAGWSATGLWHASAACAPPGACDTGPHWAYYGIDAGCNFNNGVANAGALRRSNLALPALNPGESLRLSYCSALAFNDQDSAQYAWLDANGTTLDDLAFNPILPSQSWETRTIDLTPLAGRTVSLAWNFESPDPSLAGNFRGWSVDNVTVTARRWICTPPRCPADVDDGSGTGTPDGGVTIDDLLYYIVIFTDGLIRADLDDGSGTGTPDGGVTIDDLLYFVERFTAGC